MFDVFRAPLRFPSYFSFLEQRAESTGVRPARFFSLHTRGHRRRKPGVARPDRFLSLSPSLFTAALMKEKKKRSARPYPFRVLSVDQPRSPGRATDACITYTPPDRRPDNHRHARIVAKAPAEGIERKKKTVRLDGQGLCGGQARRLTCLFPLRWLPYCKSRKRGKEDREREREKQRKKESSRRACAG